MFMFGAGKSNFCDVRSSAIFTLTNQPRFFKAKGLKKSESYSAVYDTPARSAQLQCLFRQVMRPFIVTG